MEPSDWSVIHGVCIFGIVFSHIPLVLKDSGGPGFWEVLYAFCYGFFPSFSGDHCFFEGGHSLQQNVAENRFYINLY